MSDDPVGDGNHEVLPGECMASIAHDAGFLWQTLWDLPQNSELKARRKDPYVLFPGDRVYIPDPRPGQESCQVDQNNKFVLTNPVEQLQIKITDDQDQPMKNVPYTLTVDGTTVKDDTDSKGNKVTGHTDGQGMIKYSISPSARDGRLVVGEGVNRRDYKLMFGYVHPAETTSGLQGRLLDLGFYRGAFSPQWDGTTRSARLLFQDKYNLSPTDDDKLEDTQSKAKDLFGC